MSTATQIAKARDIEYATSTDFCQIFDQDMNSLYLLSLLLTGDHDKAEQCFVEGLENAVGRNRVFKEWARSWTRRVIVQNALLMINPRPGVNAISVDNEHSAASAERPEIAAVLRLQPFDRFVFIMSVLECYSDHDCSILLNCAKREVLAARARALEQLGNAADSYRKHPSDIRSHEPILYRNSLLAHAC